MNAIPYYYLWHSSAYQDLPKSCQKPGRYDDEVANVMVDHPEFTRPFAELLVTRRIEEKHSAIDMELDYGF